VGRRLKFSSGVAFSLALLGLLIVCQVLGKYLRIWQQAALWPIALALGLTTVDMVRWDRLVRLDGPPKATLALGVFCRLVGPLAGLRPWFSSSMRPSTSL
jgi:hypothetical protein